ncbi:hypothetical protein GGTG_06957 [Gaeumannomyces tritici R3-111a-1]|uniref:Uncharacterized protein n=1 Tax=Gaeumannomyces tritici (strain R3-111a-1) TaxID=644352 RepID=J3P0B0_GAET3|nr:hypothetical protein GGTG_06957 [Gaeumannomyces tritici R3-111a-1]EJT77043.1 hypothetical protein GGTG_06957 [Gaeumannomyces tritici R3-111a-1]
METQARLCCAVAPDKTRRDRWGQFGDARSATAELTVLEVEDVTHTPEKVKENAKRGLQDAAFCDGTEYCHGRNDLAEMRPSAMVSGGLDPSLLAC